MNVSQRSALRDSELKDSCNQIWRSLSEQEGGKEEDHSLDSNTQEEKCELATISQESAQLKRIQNRKNYQKQESEKDLKKTCDWIDFVELLNCFY